MDVGDWGAVGLQVQRQLRHVEDEGGFSRSEELFAEEEEEEVGEDVQSRRSKVGSAGKDRQEERCQRGRGEGAWGAAAEAGEDEEEEAAAGVNDEEDEVAADTHGIGAEGREEQDAFFNMEEDAEATAADAAAAAARAEEKKSLRRGCRSRRFDVGTFQGASSAGGAGAGAPAAEAGSADYSAAGAGAAPEGLWGGPQQGEERDGLFDIYCRLNYMRTHRKEFKTLVRGSRRNKEIDKLHGEVEALKLRLAAKRETATAAATARAASSSNRKTGPGRIGGGGAAAAAAPPAGGGSAASASLSSSTLRVAAVELEMRRRRLARLRAERSVDLRDDLNLLLQCIDEQLLQLLPCGDSLELRAQKLDNFSWKTPMWLGYRPLLLLKHKEGYYNRWLQHTCPDPPHTLLRLLRQQQQQQEGEVGDEREAEEQQDKFAAAADTDASDVCAAASGDGHNGGGGERAAAAADGYTAPEKGHVDGPATTAGGHNREGTAASPQQQQQQGKHQHMDGEDFYVNGDGFPEEELLVLEAERQFELEGDEVEMNSALKRGRAHASSFAEAGLSTSEAPHEGTPETRGSAHCRSTEKTVNNVEAEQKQQDVTERDLQILEEKKKAAIARREERRRQRQQQ